MELKPLQKSIKLFIKMFTYLLAVDIYFCLLFQDYPHLLSSIILMGGIFGSKFFFKYDRYEAGIVFLALVFYIIGFYHLEVMDNYHTCYFILMVAPIITSLLLERFDIKIILIISSCILFMLCNYLSGKGLIENYFFFYGVVPSSLLMIHFCNRIKRLTMEKNLLIEELKEKNEEVLLFTNMMSHDLKAPLRNIEGFSNLLKKRLPDLKPQESDFFSCIIQGVNSLKKLIDNVLKYSRSGVGSDSYKEIDLEPMINQLLSTFNYDIAKKNVRIIKSDLSKIHGHEDSLFLVFQNLISNAIKYQPKDKSHIPQIEIKQVTRGNQNIIFIKDNGIGIEEKKLDQIFEPFKRFHSSSEYEGTGLGMSIVNKVIEKHNGKIEVQSELNKGSTFSVHLPILNSKPQNQLNFENAVIDRL